MAVQSNVFAGPFNLTATAIADALGYTPLNKAGDTMTGRLTITQGTVNTAVLASTGYSLTGSNATGMIDLAGTWNTSGTPTAIRLNITDTASNANSVLLQLAVGGVTRANVSKSGSMFLAGAAHIYGSTAIPAGGAVSTAFRMSSTSTFGIYFGSGAPTVSAAQGSLYIRSDGSGTADRLYVNTNGTTGWTNFVSAS